MVNFDPDTAERDSEVMKTVVRLNENYAGVYGTVMRAGRASGRPSRELWRVDSGDCAIRVTPPNSTWIEPRFLQTSNTLTEH